MRPGGRILTSSDDSFQVNLLARASLRHSMLESSFQEPGEQVVGCRRCRYAGNVFAGPRERPGALYVLGCGFRSTDILGTCLQHRCVISAYDALIFPGDLDLRKLWVLCHSISCATSCTKSLSCPTPNPTQEGVLTERGSSVVFARDPRAISVFLRGVTSRERGPNQARKMARTTSGVARDWTASGRIGPPWN